MNNKDIKEGDITFMHIGKNDKGTDMYATPGGGIIKGASNARNAAIALTNSNKELRVKRRGF